MNQLKCVIGTNSWGSKAYEKAVRGSYVNDAVIAECVDKALEHGLCVFDTAEDYGFGYAQKLIGRFLETRQFQISAKYTPIGRYKDGQVHRAFEKDCADMKTDYVDYYWLHLPNDVEQNLAEMIDLYQKGRIGNIGISNFNLYEAKHAKEYLKRYGIPLYGVQNHFSLLERENESNGMLKWCRDNNIAFWGWAVLEEGVLSGKERGPDSLMGLLFRSRTEKLQSLFNAMKEVGDHHGLTIAQVAVTYCLSKGVIPICGCRKPYQAEQLAQDAASSLTDSEVTMLEAKADETQVKILKTDIFLFAVHK